MATQNGITTENATIQQEASFLNRHMSLFDTRIYRTLQLAEKREDSYAETFYPHYAYGSFVSDFHSTPQALRKQMEGNPEMTDSERKEFEDKIKYIEDFNKQYRDTYVAPRAFVHPYALIRLAGASGDLATVNGNYTYDQYNKRKFYEVDGESTFSGNYSKTPTTTNLIRWGNESKRNRTPYSFQDFVFCKWWNKIENNRLITLRRYAAPVTDNIEFSDYEISEYASDKNKEYTFTDPNTGERRKYAGSESTNPWTPLATAVTYFGEETGNKLSNILSFSAKYNWHELEVNKQPIDVSASENDAGSNLISSETSYGRAISGGLSEVAKFLGVLGEASNQRTINLEGAPQTIPEDPYSSGPYENRILGPINVILNTWRRERGLSFTHNGLKIKFSYVARPIAGVNNKAILLDLLSNILVLTYSSGTWFGGMWRFKTSNPAVYPFKYGDSMNKLYRGELFGKDSFSSTLIKHAIDDASGYASTFLPDMMNMISGLFNGAMNFLKGAITGNKGKRDAAGEAVRENAEGLMQSSVSKAIQKVIAAKALKGTSIPYLSNQRALLTGEPVGDWHLTIGNPLNPIAMIGNLIVKNVEIEFSDELGPDDFPIGFDATVELAHGLGRDRDAIESMFNRGFGRLYTLSSEFRSSADGETKVDENTGTYGKSRDSYAYEETRNTYFGGGTRFIWKVQESPLSNKGSIYEGGTYKMKSLLPTNTAAIQQTVPKYYVTPWQMGMTL